MKTIVKPVKISVKPVNRIYKWQEKKLPHLFTFMDRSDDNTQIFTVYIDDIGAKSSYSIFAGAMMVRFDDFRLIGGKPYFSIYIHKFEVVEKWKGEGVGRAMFEWLLDNFRISKIELSHMADNIDGGNSYQFWKHMGFRKPDKEYFGMEKIFC